jgi:class 3 adenylate cyclase
VAEAEVAKTESEAIEAPNTRARLDSMLEDMLDRPEHRDEIEDEIEGVFTQQRAVMILDMSGFSRTTKDRGIVAFLLMIHQMQLLSVPCIEENNGVVIKKEADNLFCLFDQVSDAVESSLEITRRLKTANVVLPKDMELYVSIGIGYGPILNIENDDIWGSEVNLASKLGEDIAELGEVLLTEDARAQVTEPGLEFVQRSVSISGLDLNFFEVKS